MLHISPVLLVLSALGSSAKSTSGISSVTPAQWKKLHQQVGGRLHSGAPFASPCFASGSQGVNQTACTVVQNGYDDERMSFTNVAVVYFDDAQ